MERLGRMVAYWLVVGMVLWVLVWFCANSTLKGRDWLAGGKFILKNLPVEDYSGGYLLTIVGPPVVVGMLCHLLITSKGPLPVMRSSWILHPIQRIRSFGDGKMNQWGMGDHAFATVFVCFVAIPVSIYFGSNTYFYVVNDPPWFAELGLPKPEGYGLYLLSLYFGLAGAVSMMFFLVPVARHNVLLVAVGWSSVHALKLHILSAYLAYGCITLHGLTYLLYMVLGYGADGHERLIDQIIPDRSCWVWKPSEELYEKCHTQWWNSTGFAAFIPLTVLVLTSLHWVRRNYYHIFYTSHVICAFLGILFSIMHWDFLVIFMFPSVVYYVASTTPVMVQAIASRFCGGVKIREASVLKDSGGCVEVKLAAASCTSMALDTETCMVVKVCVPSISLIWHPFTVYKNPDDADSVHFLFRPIGPFTKTLASRLVSTPRPIMILDGFYRGGDRVNEALCHDVVTIVAGGVALTPFLSMIPALIQALADGNGSSVTKKLVLHWACREEGLITFITERYLQCFQGAASKLPKDVEVHLVVYHTRPVFENMKKLENSIPFPAKEFTDYDADTDLNLDDTEQNYDESERTPSDGASSGEQEDCKDAKASYGAGQGHAVEPARFMPGLYGKIAHNLVQFVLMSSLLWMAIVIYTHYSNVGHTRFKILHWLAGTWSSIVWVLVSFGFAICVELFFLMHRQLGGESYDHPVDGAYAVKVYDADAMEKADSNLTALVHRRGRPSATELFEGLEHSQCPGIFMCGPPGLTALVRTQASLENSHFGLTRYALYEEQFEM